MRLWRWRRTHQDHSGAEKFAYEDLRELLLYQNSASPFDAPIVKNMRPIGNINLFQGNALTVMPAVGISGLGGIVTGQIVQQPLQGASASSGGL